MSTPAPSNTPTSRPVTVLLVDDQAIVGESVRRMLAGEKDIQFHFCQDPAQALATANVVQPTVILQDLVMPEIEGLQLVRYFRANKSTRETPMIVLSSKEEPVIKAQAFALGANDYLVKLPDKLELIARIRYHSRAYLNLLERNEAYRQLAESQRALAEEVAQAARYVRSLLPQPLKGDIAIDWRFVPSTQLAGDIFGYHWLDADRLAVYLLDVSGHGVGSSLLAVSAGNLLAARSLPDTDFGDPGQVLSRLNDVFPMEKQNGKYFTIWYGVYHRMDRTLDWCNAGHPPAVLAAAPGDGQPAVQLLKSCGLAVGMMEGLEYETKRLTVPAAARLLVYSDGVYEVELADHSMWKHGDFVAVLTGLSPANGFVGDQLLTHVRQLGGAEVLADDFSLVEACL